MAYAHKPSTLYIRKSPKLHHSRTLKVTSYAIRIIDLKKSLAVVDNKDSLLFLLQTLTIRTKYVKVSVEICEKL